MRNKPKKPRPKRSADAGYVAAAATDGQRFRTTRQDATPADVIKDEPKQNAAAPVVEPAKARSRPGRIDSRCCGQCRCREASRVITGRQFDRLVNHKADRAGVEAFYSARNYAPLWISDNAANARAKDAISYLAQADAVGLDPNDYPTPDFKSATSPDALAEAEIKLTASALTFARHAQIGRIHYSRVGADIQYDLVAPEAAEVLGKLATAMTPAKCSTASIHLTRIQGSQGQARRTAQGLGVPDTKTEEKPEQSHVHVPRARSFARAERCACRGATQATRYSGDKDNPLYDDAVRDAVKTFQTESDIGVDGNLGPNTVRALNGEKKEVRHASADPIDTIIVNMERWRWVPRNLGNPHVMVNVPDYSLSLYDDDKVYWHTKIVAGKPGLATPMVSAEMKFITVNPTWNVPPSIIEKEYLPALEQDPQALDRIGLKLTQDADGTVHISQPPGAGNALGRIRFNFPNKFLVYQHDTPDKYLFAKEKRAFSHGCMRVQNPLTYGEKLLSLVLPKDHYTEARLESMFGGSEININFPKFIPVHLTYQTAFVDDAGKFQLREDVYGRDAKMFAILRSNERKVADIAVERAPNTSSKPVRMPAGMYGGGGGSYSYGGGNNFFDWLFSGPQGGARPYPPRNVPPPRNGNGRYSAR